MSLRNEITEILKTARKPLSVDRIARRVTSTRYQERVARELRQMEYDRLVRVHEMKGMAPFGYLLANRPREDV